MLLAAVALFAVLAVVSSRQRTATSEMRVDVATPPTADPGAMALSADGQKIVFSAISDGRSQLWLRRFDEDSARILTGTDGGLSPFWSPDGQSVGFFADGRLKRIDLDNGAVRILAAVPNVRGGTWNADGAILVGTTLGPILRIPASGGAVVPQTHLATQQIAHRSPQFLPDGRHFLFRATGAGEGLYIGQIDGPETRVLNDAEIGIFLPGGYLLFIRQEMLFAQAFDSGTLALTGEPFLVAERVLGTALSVSQSGTIAYRTGSAGSRQLNWFDRTGKELGRVAASDSGTINDIALSPDGRRLAFRQTLNGRVEIWLVELALGTSTRLTFGDGRKFAPVWSPDASRVAFQSNPKAVYDLYLKSASGAGTEELILSTPQSKTPMDWSPDGRFLLYRTGDSSASYDLWAVPVDGDRKPFPVIQSSAQERDAQFSPDGKWIAYQSDESGSFEIYLQPFVIPGDQEGQGGKWQVSHGGGAQVRWRPDGKELFYIAPDENLVAVPVRLDSLRHSVELGAAVPLFRTRVGGAVQDIVSQQYAVASDGQRFLMNTLGDEAISPITVVLNWRQK
jgi:Tol biopolymer transport system component